MKEQRDIGTMDFIAYLDALLAAPTNEARSEVFARRKAETAHLPRQWETMPAFDRRPRKSLTELRPRHLLMVEEYGFRREYDRNALGDYFLSNYTKLFGSIRKSKAREVPSDELRRELIIHRLLDLIEGRRMEYKNERAGKPRYHHLEMHP